MKKTTGVVELKAKTSEILRIVKAGHEVVVTERGVPVARLVPLDDGERRSTRRTRLFRAGLIKRGHGRLPKLLASPPEDSRSAPTCSTRCSLSGTIRRKAGDVLGTAPRSSHSCCRNRGLRC